MPANADLSTIEQLSKSRKEKRLGEDFDKKSYYISEKQHTFGVTEILKFIFKNA